jgi:hypothetical protein
MNYEILDETDIKIRMDIFKRLKDHQVKSIKFTWTDYLEETGCKMECTNVSNSYSILSCSEY